MFQNWVQAARYVSESKPHNVACYGIRSKLYDLLQNFIQTLWYFPEFDSQNLTSLAPELCVTKCPPNPCVTKCSPELCVTKCPHPEPLCHKVSPLCLCVCAFPWGDIDIRCILCMEMQRLSPWKYPFSAECAFVFKKWPRTASAAIGFPLHLHMKGNFLFDESSRCSSSPWTASQLECHTFKTRWRDICKCLRWHHTGRIRRQGTTWLVEAIALCARCCHRNLL